MTRNFMNNLRQRFMWRWILPMLLGIGIVLSSCDNDSMFLPENVPPVIDSDAFLEPSMMAELGPEMISGYQAVDKMGIIQNGAACANCHPPTMIDLAFFDFGEDDLDRRDGPHFSREIANELMSMVGCGQNDLADVPVSDLDRDHVKELREALRGHYNIQSPKNPDTYRILQPEEMQLSGANNAERDINFAKEELPKWLPTLYEREMRRKADVIPLLGELRQLYSRFHEMRIPVQFPIWSGDPADGPSNNTLNEWLTSCGFTSSNPQYIQALNNYRVNPSIENFWTFFELAKELETPINCPPGSRAVSMERHKRMASLIAGQIMHEIIKEENGQGQLRCASGCFLSDGPIAFDYRISEQGKDLQKRHFKELTVSIWDPAEIFRKPHVEGSTASERTANMGYDCLTTRGLEGLGWKAGWHKMKYSVSKDGQASWFALHHQFDASKSRGYFREATTFRHAPIFASFLDGTKPLINGGALEAAGVEPFPWSNFKNIDAGFDSPEGVFDHWAWSGENSGDANGPVPLVPEHRSEYLNFYKRMARATLLSMELFIDTGTCLEASRIQKVARALARTYPDEKLFTLEDGTEMTAEEYYYYLCAKNKEMIPQCRYGKAKDRSLDHSCEDLFEEKEKHAG